MREARFTKMLVYSRRLLYCHLKFQKTRDLDTSLNVRVQEKFYTRKEANIDSWKVLLSRERSKMRRLIDVGWVFLNTC
jgi:hypothetical protein